MHMIPSPRSRMIGAACLFAATLAACGGSSKSSLSSATTGPAHSTSAGAPGAATVTSSPSGGSSSNSGGGDINTCTLLSTSKLSTLAGHPYTAAKSQTIANGQDQCTYTNSAAFVDLDVIVYQPNSGVSFDTMKSVQTGVGAVTTVSGVGDKAIAGSIELDIQDGDRLIAVEGAAGGGSGKVSIAIGKAVVAALG